MVAPQGTSATIFFSDAARGRAAATADFLRRENWAGRVVAGTELAQVGLPTDGAMQVAVAMATDDRINPHGVIGFGAIVANPDDPEGKIGFGQHGGLGRNEHALQTNGQANSSDLEASPCGMLSNVLGSVNALPAR